jgi:hypothetical protein
MAQRPSEFLQYFLRTPPAARKGRTFAPVLATIADAGAGFRSPMARGVRFGRKPKLSAFQIAEAIKRREAGEAMTDIGRPYEDRASAEKRLEDWDKGELIPRLPYEGDGDYMERLHQEKGSQMDRRGQVIEHQPDESPMIRGRSGEGSRRG